MRTKIVLMVLFCGFLFSCDGDDYPYSKVPSVVLNSFRAQFANATDVECKPVGNHYEITYKIDKKDGGIFIDSSGFVLKERREVSWGELPVDVRNSLNEEYGKNKIKNPKIVRAGEQVHYQVKVNRFFKDEKVVVNSSGKPNASLKYWE